METSLNIRISKKEADDINSESDLCAFVDNKLKHKFLKKVKQYGL
jgi:hypothetical protein